MNAFRTWLVDTAILTNVWYRSKYTTATNRLVQRLKTKPELVKAARNERKQALTADGRIFVCYHPEKNFPIEYTKSLKKLNDPWKDMSDTMTTAQVQEAMRLKKEEPGVWGSKTLGRLFNVKPTVVKEHIQLTAEQKEILKSDTEALQFFRPYKRRLYRRLLHLHRHKRLEEEMQKRNSTE